MLLSGSCWGLVKKKSRRSSQFTSWCIFPPSAVVVSSGNDQNNEITWSRITAASHRKGSVELFWAFDEDASLWRFSWAWLSGRPRAHWRDIVQSGVEHLRKKPANMVGEPATAIQTQMSVIWIHLGRNSTSLAVSAVSQTFSSIHSFGVVFLSPTGDWKLDVIPSHPARVAHYIKHIFNFWSFFMS